MKLIVRPIIPAAALVSAVAAAPTAARAHFVWATVENGQARFALLESPGEAPDPRFEKYVAHLSPRWGGKALAPGALKGGARYAALPAAGPAAGKAVVAAESVVGVRDRGGETYLLVYHAKGAASLAAAGAAAGGAAEVLARREGGTLFVTVRQGGWPLPHAEAWVHWPGQEAPGSVRTDLKGEARVPWPPATPPSGGGFVGVRAMVKEAKAGEAGGKRYAAVHRWATLTFPVEKPEAEAGKPFSQVLRASYAHNHEVVGGAAFNKTLFAGALTRAQLETHLQQRALVHNEAHRVLVSAARSAAGGAAARAPYGPAQKQVLVLLFTDLIALGSGWPTEAQARPLTRAFLREIRDSEKRGPFFSLGVQHVYYGGVTNGGRMIGAKIGRTLGFTPSYYEKSGGYREYLAEVDRIEDPGARREMIRGGQAAYRYIIASSNEDVFRTRVAAEGAARD